MNRSPLCARWGEGEDRTPREYCENHFKIRYNSPSRDYTALMNNISLRHYHFYGHLIAIVVVSFVRGSHPFMRVTFTAIEKSLFYPFRVFISVNMRLLFGCYMPTICYTGKLTWLMEIRVCLFFF